MSCLPIYQQKQRLRYLNIIHMWGGELLNTRREKERGGGGVDIHTSHLFFCKASIHIVVVVDERYGSIVTDSRR